jgi:hypothetical protein
VECFCAVFLWSVSVECFCGVFLWSVSVECFCAVSRESIFKKLYDIDMKHTMIYKSVHD